MLTPEQWSEALGTLLESARARPDRRLDIHGPTGEVIATLVVHELAKRPRDMPRALRPKQKLSKRQRAQAKHEKQHA